MSDMRLVVAGAGGRMGRTLIKAIAETKGLTLAGALEAARLAAARPGRGRTLPALGKNRHRDLVGCRSRCCRTPTASSISPCRPRRATSPQLAAKARHRARHRHDRLLGRRRSQDQGRGGKSRDRQVRQYEPRRQSAGGAGQARGEDARRANSISRSLEMHHNKKIDAPSGTALLLGHAAAEGRGIDLRQARSACRAKAIPARAKPAISALPTLRGGTRGRRAQCDFCRPGRAHRARPIAPRTA